MLAPSPFLISDLSFRLAQKDTSAEVSTQLWIAIGYSLVTYISRRYLRVIGGAGRNDSPMPSAAGIFTVHRGEFQPHSTSGPYVLHNSLGPNRAFLDKK